MRGCADMQMEVEVVERSNDRISRTGDLLNLKINAPLGSTAL